MRSRSIHVYSRYVKLMKIILPIGILLSIGLALGWPYLRTSLKDSPFMIDSSSIEIREKHMLNPHYVSTDNKGQPFHLTAQRAKQQNKEHADLTSPKGSMTMLEGETFNVDSKKGQYNTNNKMLTLEENVTLTSTDGYHIKTEKARLSVDGKTIEGDELITGSGPAGEIRAEKGFKVETHPEGKKVITLKGRSRVVINNTSVKKKKVDNEN